MDRLAQNQQELDEATAGRSVESERALKEYLLALLMEHEPPGHFANLVAEAKAAVR